MVGEWADCGPLATFFWKKMRSISEGEAVTEEMTIEERMKEENQIREKTESKPFPLEIDSRTNTRVGWVKEIDISRACSEGLKESRHVQ